MNNIKDVYLKRCANIIPELRKEGFVEWKVKALTSTNVGCPSRIDRYDCEYGRGHICQCPIKDCCDYQPYDESDWKEFIRILDNKESEQI